MTLSCDVAIIGGGIGGLTLASSLAQRPISVMDFEQDTNFERSAPALGPPAQRPGSARRCRIRIHHARRAKA